jgi:hypothetical protein
LGGSIGKHDCLDGALLRLNFAQEIDWFVEGQIEGHWPTFGYLSVASAFALSDERTAF